MPPAWSTEGSTAPSRAAGVAPALGVLAAFAALALGPPPGATRLLAVGLLAATGVFLAARARAAAEARERAAALESLHRTAGGDLTLTHAELLESNDPGIADALHGLLLGTERILGSFARLAAAIGDVAADLTSRSRDLSRTANEQSDRAQDTAQAILSTDDAVSSLRTAMEELAAVAESAGASLAEMSASVTQVSQGTGALRAFVEETAQAVTVLLVALDGVAASVDELSRVAAASARAGDAIRAATRDTEREARTGTLLAERVAEAAAAGKGAVSGTSSGIAAIRDGVALAARAAAALGERSLAIGEVLRVLSDLAGETNLLALNAELLAARSGEEGRAVSVVAHDIRSLSDRAAASTEEVRLLVRAVRDGVDDVGRVLADVEERAETGVALASAADARLVEIESLSSESRAASVSIARAAARQAAEAALVSDGAARVSEEVSRIGASTRSQVETARGVSHTAGRVRESTEQLARALDEQAAGSRALLASMESVTSTVESIAEATATLADGSASVVRSMDGIRAATERHRYAATAIAQTAQALEQESLLLRERAIVFRLPEPAAGGRLRAALRYLDVDDFDPVFAASVPHAILALTWGETLLRFGEGTRLLPSLAERWDVHPAGTSVTIHLRRGVLFHGGGVLSSRDVKASFERFLSPALGASLASAFDAVAGARAYREGNAPGVAGIETLDPATVVFRLERPTPFFLPLLTLPETTVVAPSARDRETARRSPSGTGPFTPVELAFGKSARLDRFDGHRDRARVSLDGLDLDLREDSEAGVFERFAAGELDVTWDVPYDEAARLLAEPRTRPFVDASVQLHTAWVALRCDRAPLADVRVRRALSHAVDRFRLNEKLFSGLAIPAASILPPHLLGHEPDLAPYRYDPARAKALLAEAGHASGLRLSAWVSPRDARDPRSPFAAVLRDLEAVGVSVAVEELSGDERAARAKKGEHPDLQPTRWFADYPDPDTFFGPLFHSGQGDVAGTGYRNPELDRLVDSGARVLDHKEREEIYRRLNRLVQSEAPGLFLFHARSFVAFRPGLRGVRSHFLLPPVRWTDLWWERGDGRRG